MAFRWLARRQNRGIPPSPYPTPNSSPSGYGYGMNSQPYGGGGLWRSILGGLGFGAGAAAGEYAIDRFLHSNREPTSTMDDNDPASSQGQNFGGDNFGIASGTDPGVGGWSDSSNDQSGTNTISGDFGVSDGGNDDGWDDSSGGGGTDV
jgi:hypothetical protein